MPSDAERLATVRQCVDQLYAARHANGQWAALERALIDIFVPKKKTPTWPNGRDYDYDAGGHWVKVGATCAVCAMSDEALIQASRASRSQAPPTPAGDNVIILTRALVTRDAHAEEGMSARRRAKGGQPPVPSGCAGRHADHPRG